MAIEKGLGRSRNGYCGERTAAVLNHPDASPSGAIPHLKATPCLTGFLTLYTSARRPGSCVRSDHTFSKPQGADNQEDAPGKSPSAPSPGGGVQGFKAGNKNGFSANATSLSRRAACEKLNSE
ncbi:hypothetical protein MKZ38_010574 [Zalerion maritima]|uniref:Uncharacterized protein n=1 Tax=Zalerion maritima TaxID=339359 RepID=A0AAD5WSE3_9PEZI|nr:hypothetical protein MKZ38_010574 [Zalerion maritima]